MCRPIKCATIVPDTSGAGSFVLYANINKPGGYSAPQQTAHIEANITNAFNGILVYENHTTQLRNGDMVHFWIIVYFLDGSYRTLINQTFDVEMLAGETLSKTETVHATNASHLSINTKDYINSILEKINSTEIIDLHKRVPHEPISDYFYKSVTDERTSYIEKIIAPSSEWF